jgi:hypothetical protein
MITATMFHPKSRRARSVTFRYMLLKNRLVLVHLMTGIGNKIAQ